MQYAVLVIALLFSSVAASAANAVVPNFSPDANSGWRVSDSGPYFLMNSPGEPKPAGVDSAIASKVYTGRMFPIVRLDNPNLQPWVVDALRKQNESVLAGQPLHSLGSSCWPNSPYSVHEISALYPLRFVQTVGEVIIFSQYDDVPRHVLLNQLHSSNPKPSWQGEAVGHYENGDTLVVDTIGFSDKVQLDFVHTPHTRNLHLIERFKLAGDGRAMEATVHVEDSIAFKAPYEVIRHYRLVQDPFLEVACAETPGDPLHQGLEPLAQADKPDF
jgi:hypothetical protein